MHCPFPSHLLSLALTAIRSCRYRCRHRRCRHRRCRHRRCRHRRCRRGPYRGCRRRAGELLPLRRMADETFWRRYGPLFRRIRREYPGFWEELREVAERHQRQMYTSHGARVRDWPEARSVGVQAGAPQRDAGAQLDRRSTPEPDRPVLWIPAVPRLDRIEVEEPEDWNDPQPVAQRDDRRGEGGAERDDRPAARGGGPGCWNYGSRARYSVCPHLRRSFCYECGAVGVTLRDCERCAEGWKRLGLYHPEQGHDWRRE